VQCGRCPRFRLGLRLAPVPHTSVRKAATEVPGSQMELGRFSRCSTVWQIVAFPFPIYKCMNIISEKNTLLIVIKLLYRI